MQELLRHASSRVTMDTYTQACHGTKTQRAEWSDSFSPRPRYGAGNWGVSLCLFVPTKKPTTLGKCSCGTAGRRDLAVLRFLFVPAKNKAAVALQCPVRNGEERQGTGFGCTVLVPRGLNQKF